MPASSELASLYHEARSALKARDYDRAIRLLKQILIIDENYQDASRLLAQAVKLKRRRWYNDLRIWIPVIGIAAIALIAWLASAVNWKALAPKASSTPSLTPSATFTLLPTSTPSRTTVPTATASPTPTQVPLAWQRLNMGQAFSRDTVNAIVISPSDPDVMYVGMQNAGIYKSIDSGLSWRPAFSGLASTSISSMVIDPQDPSILNASSSSGIYKTQDGGNNWKVPYPHVIGGFLSVDPQDGRHIFRFSPFDLNLRETRDGGEKWMEYIVSCPNGFLSLSIDPDDSQILWALPGYGNRSCPPGLYQSTDGGGTWSLKVTSSEYGFKNGGFEKVFTDRQTGNTVYVYMYDNDYQNNFNLGILVSKDGGETWVKRGNPVAQCRVMAVDPADEDIIYCGASTEASVLYKTVDGGRTWQAAGYPKVGMISALVISPTDSRSILVGGQGLAISRNGGVTFERLENGLGGRFIEIMLNPADHANLFAYEGPAEIGGSCPLYRSTDGGHNWLALRSGYEIDHACGLAIDADGKNLYRIMYYWLRHSIDAGQSWEEIYYEQDSFFTGLAAHPSLPGVLFASHMDDNNLIYSEDKGKTWIETSSLGRSPNWVHFYFDHQQGQVMYMDGEKDVTIHRSGDGGKIIGVACNKDEIPRGRSDTNLAVDPADSNRLFIGSRGGGVYFSADGCKSWKSTNNGLENLYVNTLAVDLNQPGTIYAGTDGGAYVSFNYGIHWGQINEGLLGATVVYSIVVDKDSNVYAATPYGIFQLTQK